MKDTLPPTADILNVAPDPRNMPAGTVTIAFSEDVVGVDITDVRLTRNGNGVNIGGLSITACRQASTRLIFRR